MTARRHPARPEPGDPDLPRHLPVGLVEARLQLLERNFDGQLDPGRAELFDVGLHLGSLPGKGPCRWRAPRRRGPDWLVTHGYCAPSLGQQRACSPATGDDHGNSATSRWTMSGVLRVMPGTWLPSAGSHRDPPGGLVLQGGEDDRIRRPARQRARARRPARCDAVQRRHRRHGRHGSAWQLRGWHQGRKHYGRKHNEQYRHCQASPATQTGVPQQLGHQQERIAGETTPARWKWARPARARSRSRSLQPPRGPGGPCCSARSAW